MTTALLLLVAAPAAAFLEPGTIVVAFGRTNIHDDRADLDSALAIVAPENGHLELVLTGEDHESFFAFTAVHESRSGQLFLADFVGGLFEVTAPHTVRHLAAAPSASYSQLVSLTTGGGQVWGRSKQGDIWRFDADEERMVLSTSRCIFDGHCFRGLPNWLSNGTIHRMDDGGFILSGHINVDGGLVFMSPRRNSEILLGEWRDGFESFPGVAVESPDRLYFTGRFWVPREVCLSDGCFILKEQGHGIFAFDVLDSKVTALLEEDASTCLSDPNCKAGGVLALDSAGQLLSATSSGLSRIDPQTGKHEWIVKKWPYWPSYPVGLAVVPAPSSPALAAAAIVVLGVLGVLGSRRWR